MDKKDVSIIIGIGALFTSAYSAYMLNKQRESQDRLNKKIKRLATCHNHIVELEASISDECMKDDFSAENYVKEYYDDTEERVN